MMQSVGGGTAQNQGGNGRNYISAKKSSELSTPGPVNVLVFLDENGDGINDGTFAFKCGFAAGSEAWQDLPATYHNRNSSFSFADGHSEIHKWLDGRTYQGAWQCIGDSTHIPWNGYALTKSADYEWVDDHLPYQ